MMSNSFLTLAENLLYTGAMVEQVFSPHGGSLFYLGEFRDMSS